MKEIIKDMDKDDVALDCTMLIEENEDDLQRLSSNCINHVYILVDETKRMK